MSCKKWLLGSFLLPGVVLFLCFAYIPMTKTWWRGSVEKRPQRYPLPKAQRPTPVQNQTEPDAFPEDPGLYHVAYPRLYKFIIDQPEICDQQKPYVVIIVPVPPGDADARDGIRRTWGGENLIEGKTILVLFLMGLRDEEHLQERLHNESERYGDLLQSDFLDTYRNLTIKTMVMMEWLSRNCQQASYAVKVDADVLLNVKNLLHMLASPNVARGDYMTGLVWYNSVVIRNPDNKFFLPYEVFPRSTYPPYPLGMCYIISLDLPQKFLRESRRIKPIYIEDAYLGMCLERLGISPTNPPNMAQFVVQPPQYNRCFYSTVVAILTADTRQMVSFWTDVHSTDAPC